jgi:hypothetical protein
VARDLELNVKSKTSGEALARTAAELDRTAREAEKLGRAFDAAKRDSEQLDREIVKNAAAVKLLAHEYSSAEGEIRKGIKARLDAERAAGTELRKVRHEIIGDSEKDASAAAAAFAKATREFEKVSASAARESERLASDAARESKRLASDAAREAKRLATSVGSDGAKTFSSVFQGGIIDAFKSAPPELKAAVVEGLVVSVVAAAAPIGAAINGALLAGIGLGGIGLGIAGQLSNPEVQAAGKQLGADLKADLTAATTGFAGPLAKALGILDKSAGRGLGKLKSDFDDLARHVEPLARGIAGLFEQAEPGFEKALAAAGPIVDELAAKLPGLGQNISKAFALLADGSAGGKDGLDLLILTVETLTVGVAGLIDGFSHLYHAFLAPGREVLSWWDQLRGNTHGAAVGLDEAAVSADGFGQAAESGIGSLAELNSQLHKPAVTVDTIVAGAVDKLVGEMLGLDQATLGFDESLTHVGESLKQNGKSLDEHTAKGQANRSTILDGVAANLRLYDAEVASGTSAEEAGKKFQAHNDQLRAAAIAAGFNADEVDRMIKKYGKVPPEIQTQIEMHGLTQAISNLDETLRLINHLPSRASVDIDVNVHGNLYSARNAIADILGSGFVSSGIGKRKRAHGGPVVKGQPYIVGEHRPEVFVPNVDGTILPSVPKSMTESGPSVSAMWGGNGSGSQAITVTLNLAGSDTAMGTALHGLVRTGVAQFVAVDSSGNRLPVKVA